MLSSGISSLADRAKPQRPACVGSKEFLGAAYQKGSHIVSHCYNVTVDRCDSLRQCETGYGLDVLLMDMAEVD